jgi:heterotetrameric sarcosine oxidase delta subunit
MRIECPFCGWRDSGEFTVRGDAKPQRPSLPVNATPADVAAAQDAAYDYVFLRDNVAGLTSEHWYHGGGCRSWLVVERDTLTHRIASVRAAQTGAAPARTTVTSDGA